jgi:hypothetical protein
MTFVSAYYHPEGVYFVNGPFVPRTPEGEEMVRDFARGRVRAAGGFTARRLDAGGKLETYFSPVSEVELEECVSQIVVWMCPFYNER